MTTMTELSSPVTDLLDACRAELEQLPAPQQIGAQLSLLRTVLDLRERLAQLDKLLGSKRSELEASLVAEHERSGIDSLKGGGVSVSFDATAMRAAYDPDKWAEVVKWAIKTDNLHVIQRRLTDSKVESLVAEGVALPEGLRLESYIKVSVRRI